jgi:hypothetical protein
MPLSREPKYPSSRAYVLKLTKDASPDALCGRIENLTTGSQRSFACGDELLVAVARDLESTAAASDADDANPAVDRSAPAVRSAPSGPHHLRNPSMNNPNPLNDLSVGHTAMSLEELDRELARLALLCRVRILDPGVIERVLHNDASVCGTTNAIAFGKLRDLLMMHLALRTDLAGSMGQTMTAALESLVIERLRKSFPDLGAAWPPA